MTFCPECGSENAPDKKFCTNCGKALVTSTAAPGTTPAFPPPAPFTPPQSSPSPVPSPTPGPGLSRTTMVIAAGIIIIAIIIAVVIGYPMLTKNSPKSDGAITITPTTTPRIVTALTTVPIETQTPNIPVATASMPTTTADPASLQYKKFSSDQFGFSIDYPADWQVSELNELETPSLTRYNVVEFYSPSIERCDTDRSKCSLVRGIVDVEVENNPGTDELADYFVPETAKILASNGAQITKRDAMYKLSGTKAYRLDYMDDVGGYDRNLISAYTIIKGRAYILTYSALAPVRGETDLFKEHYNTADHMFTSFTV